MTKRNRIISVLLCTALVLSLLAPVKVQAVKNTGGVFDRIVEMQKLFPAGSFFTESGRPCTTQGTHPQYGISGLCNNCSLMHIVQRKDLEFLNYVKDRDFIESWTCVAFARFAYRFIYGEKCDASHYSKVYSEKPSQTTFSYAKTGDLLVWDGQVWSEKDKKYVPTHHEGIYIDSDATGAITYDGNNGIGSNESNRTAIVHFGHWTYAQMLSYYGANSKVTIYRARNYDSVNGSSGSTPSVPYAAISSGTYALKNNATGRYLSVVGGKDADKTNIGNEVWNPGSQRLYFSSVGDNYTFKMRPLCSSNKLVNAWGVSPENGANVNLYKDVNDITQWWKFLPVSGGYAVLLASNTSLALTATGTDVIISTYSGASSQIWFLESSATYTISYNANGGSGAPGNQTKYQGHNVTLSASVPTKAGCTFLGWATSASASAPQWSAGSSFSADSNITLYAVWKTNHTHTPVQRNRRDPSCTEAGYSGDQVCSSCGQTISSGSTIPALGHNMGEWVQITAPTCDTKGTETSTCSRCGIKDSRSVPEIGHSRSGMSVASPTKNSSGAVFIYCSRCEVITSFHLPELNPVDYTVTVIEQATCTSGGIDRYTFKYTDYGVFEFDDITEELGHAWNGGVVTVEPTEEREGLRLYTCTRCSATKTTVLPVLEHIHNYSDVVVEATCTAYGYTTHSCACGDTYIDSYVPALGHSFTGWGVSTPTETSMGSVDCYCFRCGVFTVTLPILNMSDYTVKLIKEATCTTNRVEEWTWKDTTYGVIDFYVYKPALGHDWDTGTVTKEPTETEEGTNTFTCLRCGDTMNYALPVIHVHHYVGAVTPPTCVDRGYTIYTCYGCGDQYQTELTDSLGGHDWDNGTVLSVAGFEGDGILRFVCKRCGEIEDKVTPRWDKAGKCGDDVYWNVSEDYVLVIHGNGEMYDFWGTGVACPWAAFAQKIVAVVVDTGVTKIGSSAFGDCYHIRDILLPDSIREIGVSAIGSFDLQYLELPSSLETFYPESLHTWGLKAFGLRAGNTTYSVRDGVLFNADGTVLLAYPKGKEGDYVVPESVKIITRNAFDNARGLTSISFAGDTEIIDDSAFIECVDLGSVILPDSLTYIGEYAFQWCPDLTDIFIPGSVETIGRQAFFDCRSLQNVTLSEGTVELGNSCFQQCPFTSITIPKSVSVIGEYAFGDYRKDVQILREITFLGDMPNMNHSFELRSLTVFYPGCNSTYTSEAMDSEKILVNSSNITWIPMDHQYEVECVIEPTCTTIGYSGNRICAICGNIEVGEIIPAIPCPSAAFTDVKATAWYHNAVDYVLTQGVMTGMSTTSFAPTGNMTRAQLAQIFYNMAGRPTVSGPSPFTDVKEKNWFFAPVVWAAEKGIVNGMTASTFAPNGFVTREQMVVMLYRAYGNGEKAEANHLTEFTDGSKVSSYARDAVNWAIEHGYLKGSGGKLNPKDNMTRAQVATVFMNYLQANG